MVTRRGYIKARLGHMLPWLRVSIQSLRSADGGGCQAEMVQAGCGRVGEGHCPEYSR